MTLIITLSRTLAETQDVRSSGRGTRRALMVLAKYSTRGTNIGPMSHLDELQDLRDGDDLRPNGRRSQTSVEDMSERR